MKKILQLLLIFSFGCAPMRTLNLRPHEYGDTPRSIIWLQIAGLSENHLALKKFYLPSGEENLKLEQVHCLGKTWHYDLFNLRPSAFDSFQTQITGRNNKKEGCNAYSEKPIWSYLAAEGFDSIIWEVGAGKNSLKNSVKCEEKNGSEILKETSLLVTENRRPAKDALTFHANDEESFDKGKIYHDLSCSRKGCFSSFSANFFSIHQRWKKQSAKEIMLVRDYTYREYIRRGKIKKAVEFLEELEKILTYLLKEQMNANSTLVLLTSAAPLPLNYPLQGKQWLRIEREGRKVPYQRQALMSPVFSFGARSENFCGLYQDSEILPRLLKGAESGGIEILIQNPFS